jgi:hypothetical protein
MSVFISLIMDVLDITLTLGTTVITLGSILYGVIVFGIGIWFFKNLLGSNHSPIDIGLPIQGTEAALDWSDVLDENRNPRHSWMPDGPGKQSNDDVGFDEG